MLPNQNNMKKKQNTLIFLPLLIFFIVFLLFNLNKTISSPYLLSSLQVGEFNKTLSASGTISPRSVISVGTQVSGIVENVYVDKNSVVKKGQIIATLDKKLFSNSVDRNLALVKKLKARMELSKLRLERIQKLAKDKFISAEEIDEKTAQLKIDEADYDLGKANLQKAMIEKNYTDIKSPIDGIVLDKLVEPGQTVAASLTTPILFRIAENLDDMQITVKVPEADIALISLGQKGTFVVSAYPNKEFIAHVEKIMVNNNLEEGVVSYDVLMRVSNPQQLLKPGMSADLKIQISQVKSTNYILTNALRFKPEVTIPVDPNKTYVYVWEHNKIIPVEVKTGLENDEYTQILAGDLNVNQKIIVGLSKNDSP